MNSQYSMEEVASNNFSTNNSDGKLNHELKVMKVTHGTQLSISLHGYKLFISSNECY